MATSGHVPRWGWLTAVVVGLLLGGWLGGPVAAQGPYTAQIQRALRALGLTSGGSPTFGTVTATTVAPTTIAWANGTQLTSTVASGKLTLTGTTPMIQLGGVTSGFAAMKNNSAVLEARVADDSAYTGFKATTINPITSYLLNGVLMIAVSAPSNITACGAGTAPSFAWTNGTAAFEIITGSSTPVATCSWTMPAASHGWSCDVKDITTQSTSVFLQKETAYTTTSVTVTNYNTAGAATAVVASDHLLVTCLGG